MPRRPSRSRRSRKSTSRSAAKWLVLLAFLTVFVCWLYRNPAVARRAWERARDLTRPPESAPVFVPRKPASGYDNLALGVPGEADCVIDRPGYALGYSERDEQASWVVYRLTAKEAKGGLAERGNDFRSDPEIPNGSATPSDYARSRYDRGHLAPAGDMAWSKDAMGDSFYMSNMSPQKPAFNRGVWKRLEEQVRHFAESEGSIYVVTGPVLADTCAETIGANAVTVPLRYYKVIYDETPPEKAIGFIMPNEGSDRPLQDFVVSVDEVEKATGLDFFSELPQPRQEELEAEAVLRDWKWR